jgi:hypothetical protein
MPYQGVRETDMYRMIERGETPLIPTKFEDSPVADLVRRCWRRDPAERPTFDWICDAFESGILALPYAYPSGVRDMIRLVKQQRRSWIWDARKYAQQIAKAALKKKDYTERLFAAAIDGDVQHFAKYFTMTKAMNINMADKQGWTPLHLAASAGETVMVGFLAGIADIDMNRKTPQKDTPLMLAVKNNQVETAQLLLEDERVDVSIVDADGDAVLHVAIKALSIDVLRYLLARNDRAELVTVRDAAGKLPHLLARESGCPDIVTLLDKP